MTLEELKKELAKIKEIQLINAKNNEFYEEENHQDADNFLLKYINDEEVTRLFNEINK